MINLIRGEFYKLRKSKCVYVCTILALAFVLFFYGLYELSDHIALAEASEQNSTVSVSAEVENENVESVWDSMTVIDIAQVAFNTYCCLIIVVFIALFVYLEYANGGIKNIVGKGYQRWKIFLTKYLVVQITVIMLALIMSLFILVLGVGFMGQERLTQDILENFFRYVGMEIVLICSLTSIIVAINQFCRNLGTGIMLSMGMILFSSVLSTGIDLVLKYFKFEVRFSDYWIPELISNCPIVDIERNFVLRASISAVVWMVLAISTALTHFKKADIK